MRHIFASCPISAFWVRISIAGIVSDLESESSISDWQETDDFESSAFFCTTTELRKVLIPPLFEIERVLTTDDVRGAAWTTLQPVSRFWPFPANVTLVNSERAPSPASTLIG